MSSSVTSATDHLCLIYPRNACFWGSATLRKSFPAVGPYHVLVAAGGVDPQVLEAADLSAAYCRYTNDHENATTTLETLGRFGNNPIWGRAAAPCDKSKSW